MYIYIYIYIYINKLLLFVEIEVVPQTSFTKAYLRSRKTEMVYFNFTHQLMLAFLTVAVMFHFQQCPPGKSLLILISFYECSDNSPYYIFYRTSPSSQFGRFPSLGREKSTPPLVPSTKDLDAHRPILPTKHQKICAQVCLFLTKTAGVIIVNISFLLHLILPCHLTVNIFNRLYAVKILFLPYPWRKWLQMKSSHCFSRRINLYKS